ncbi:hypothetical protein D3C87_1924430 [compost metagenome]
MGWNHRASAVVAVAAASQRPTACTPEEAEPPNADSRPATEKAAMPSGMSWVRSRLALRSRSWLAPSPTRPASMPHTQ